MVLIGAPIAKGKRNYSEARSNTLITSNALRMLKTVKRKKLKDILHGFLKMEAVWKARQTLRNWHLKLLARYRDFNKILVEI